MSLMTDRISLERYLYFLVIMLFMVGLGGYALENINEGLYAEIPREMLELKEYIIPHLNFVPYLEKPPLLYWLIALSYKIFGVSEFSARLVPALAAVTTIFIVLQFMRTIKVKTEGVLAGVMLSSSVIFVLLSRIVIFDMLLTAFVTGAMCCFYLWYETDNVKYLQWSYGFVGLAVMTKGLIALVVAPLVALIFMLTQLTSAKKFWQFCNVPGILLFLLITLPWHVLASLSLPDFAYQYFINEHWLRFLDLRIPHDYHTGPWYFYLPRILIYSLPWTLFLPYLFRPSGQHKSLIMFCWIWLAIPLIFLSISKAKGDYYMVLGMVPLVILLACKMSEYIDEPDYRTPLMIFYALLIGLLLFVGLLVLGGTMPAISHLLPKKLLLQPFIVGPAAGVWLSLIVLGVVGYLAIRLSWFKLPVVYALFASIMLPGAMFLVVDKARYESRHSEKAIAQAILQLNDNMPVYLYKDYEDLSSINFYLQKRVSIIDSRSSDLYYGARTQKGHDWFVTMEDIKNLEIPIFVVMKPKNALHFNQDFCLAHRAGSSVLLTNNKDLCL